MCANKHIVFKYTLVAFYFIDIMLSASIVINNVL